MNKTVFAISWMISVSAFAGTRDFDGVDDRISFGSDASIGGFTTKTVGLWIDFDVTNPNNVIATKQVNPNDVWFFRANAGALDVRSSWTTTAGAWNVTQTVSADTRYYIVLAYDGSSTANDPVFYINNTVPTVTETGTPAGTLGNDSTRAFFIGTTSALSFDFNGQINCLAYDDSVWDATKANRALWWGRPNGGVEIYHPFYTSKLDNEGTATANGTATGSTMAATFTPPSVRPGTILLGMGVGW